MDILLILFICLVFYFGYVVGSSVTYYRLSRIFLELAESLGVNLQNELTKIKNIRERDKAYVARLHLYQLETEVHGDMIYLYDKERNDFICQANSIEELAKLAKEIKQIDDAVVVHGDKVFMFSDGKSQEKSTV